MQIICTFVICLSICIAAMSIFKISKSDNKKTEKNNHMPIVMLSCAYICSFISLYVLFKEYSNFDMFKFLGVCSYWLFAGVTLFSFLNLILFSDKNKHKSFQEYSVGLVKKLTLITFISILWVVSNILLDKHIYIIFSVPAVMLVIVIIILAKFKFSCLSRQKK